MFAQADLKAKLKRKACTVQLERNAYSCNQFDTVFWQILTKQ